MDKRDDRVRRYIAQRCDLLGAIRLPNNAFLANAGTEINTDILFFQKRETPRDVNVDLPDWVEVERLYENDHVNGQGESRHRVVCLNPYFRSTRKWYWASRRSYPARMGHSLYASLIQTGI